MVYKGYEIKKTFWASCPSYDVGVYIEDMLVDVFRTVVEAKAYIDSVSVS